MCIRDSIKAAEQREGMFHPFDVYDLFDAGFLLLASPRLALVLGCIVERPPGKTQQMVKCSVPWGKFCRKADKIHAFIVIITQRCDKLLFLYQNFL